MLITRFSPSPDRRSPIGGMPGSGLKSNTRALISLYLVMGLLAFTVDRTPALDALIPRCQDCGSDQSCLRGPDRAATDCGRTRASERRLGAADARSSAAPARSNDPETLAVWRMNRPTSAVRLLWDLRYPGAAGLSPPIGACSTAGAGSARSACRLPDVLNSSANGSTAFEDRLDLKPRTLPLLGRLSFDSSEGEEVGFETLRVVGGRRHAGDHSAEDALPAGA